MRVTEFVLPSVLNHNGVHRSFGVLMWEILTRGEYPYTELSDSEVIHGICYEFQRLLQPVDCTEKMQVLLIIKAIYYSLNPT